MKRILLFFGFVVFTLIASAQQNYGVQKFDDKQKVDDLQKVKDALVNSVIYCQALEKQNDNLNALIKRVADDLRTIKTIEQLDSLKVVYGIEVQKKQTKKGSDGSNN